MCEIGKRRVICIFNIKNAILLAFQFEWGIGQRGVT